MLMTIEYAMGAMKTRANTKMNGPMNVQGRQFRLGLVALTVAPVAIVVIALTPLPANVYVNIDSDTVTAGAGCQHEHRGHPGPARIGSRFPWKLHRSRRSLGRSRQPARPLSLMWRKSREFPHKPFPESPRDTRAFGQQPANAFSTRCAPSVMCPTQLRARSNTGPFARSELLPTNLHVRVSRARSRPWSIQHSGRDLGCPWSTSPHQRQPTSAPLPLA